MPNKYKENKELSTIGELMDEEDRECLNDLMRAQTSYYNTLTEINSHILRVLNNMSEDEIRNTFMGNRLRIPVKSIKE